jgi:menaquinone-dependent protoporphyrinogen oxidase
MANILILYSTTDGHTLEICQRLKSLSEQAQHEVSLVSINESAEVELRSFDKIVIGASIRYGKHNPLVAEFIRKNQPLLESKPSAFFSVNVVARREDRLPSLPFLRSPDDQIHHVDDRRADAAQCRHRLY